MRARLDVHVRARTHARAALLLFLPSPVPAVPSLPSSFRAYARRLYLRNVVDAHASLGVINTIIISTKRSYRTAVFSSSTVVFLVPAAGPSNPETFTIQEIFARGFEPFFPLFRDESSFVFVEAVPARCVNVRSATKVFRVPAQLTC